MIVSFHFQEYMALGISAMVGTGYLFSFFDRRKMYAAGRTVSWVPFAFSWLYLVLVAPDLELIFRTVEFELFFSNPALIHYLLMASLVSPIIVSRLSRRTLGISYMTYGAILVLSLPWSIPRPVIAAMTVVSAASLAAMGALKENSYLKAVNVEKKALSLVEKKGTVSIEDIMKVLELADHEAREIMYRLWNTDQIDYNGESDRYGPKGHFMKCKSGTRKGHDR